MTTAPRTNSRRMYSWWWDSHISPKNSKWLQENLTDMDVKVKQMIKLLESDADSFARRAEMYYKKRPELMKLVEEFYRAYRALAERYDNATGVLRQAHRTITEAFPNQVTFDDSPAGLSNEGDPQTPEMPSPIRALFDPDELQKDGLGLGLSPQSNAGCRNGAFTDESYTVTSRRGLKKFNDIFDSGEGRAKKGLNFHDFEENDRNGANNLKVSGTEAEISALKEALAKLEAEKEAGLLQYQQSLDKLSNLQSEVSRAQEDSERLNDRASKAETESHNLREALKKLESEQEASLLKYQQCLDKVSILESDIFDIQRGCEELTERASKAENEKEAALARYQLSLERIVKLEEKLHHAEESSRRYNELADKAESELIILKQAVEKLTDEKEAAAFQYLQRLEKISSLEYRLSCAEEEAERLHREIDDGVLKLRNVEEKCLLLETSNLALQSELETLVMKTGSQNQELTDNQKELGRLWSCIQDEHLRFVEAETAFQTLQDLHSQTEEELRSLAAELQKRTQFLKSLEIQNESLVAEVEEAKNENRKLDELNMSSALSIKNLQDELSSLREKLTKLEAEVEHRTNERNALQQEIYCLKEEINELNKKNEKLQDEKAALLEKLIILEKLVEKNAFLENSISDMSVDLEETKDRVNILEESCQSLLGDKSALSSEKVALTSLLQVTTKNLDELSEKNTHLENSLSDVVAELEALRVKSKDLEVSCQLLDQQKSGLVTERESLLYQLEDMDKRCRESVEKHSVLSNEKESVFCEMEKLKVYLDAEKQAHSSSTEISEKRLAGMESQMRLLQEECDQWRKEYEGETDKAIDSQFVIFILQNCMQDMKDNNLSLYLESQKLFEELGRSKEAISELELENLKKLEQIKSFIEKNKILRTGLQHVLRTFDIHAYREFDHEADLDQTLMEHIFCKLDEKQNSINEIYDEYYKLVIEKTVTEKFLVQLKNEAANILMERDALDQENEIQSEQISTLQSRILVLNEKRKLKEQALKTEMENVCRNLHNVQEAYQLLQVANSNALDAKASLTKEVFELGKRRRRLEEENNDMFNETIFQNQLFPICKDIIHEILEEMRKLAKCRDELQFRNDDLEERVKELERKLGYEKAMNLELAMFLEKSRSEAENYLTEKNTLDMEHRNQSERYSTLQVEMEKLLELNEEMRLKIVEGSRKEEAVTTEMENVCKKLQNLEGAYKILHDESCKANEERQELEEVNINMFTEIMFQTELSFIYEDAISENLAELRKLNECMDELHCRNNELEEGVKVMSEKLGDEQTKNVELVHSLEKARHEAENDLMERKMLDQELRNQSELNTKLMELNEEMRLKIVEGSRKEEALTTEMENVCKKLQNLEEAYEILHAENCKALEEEKSLTNEILSLKKEKRELEDANVGIFGETMFQSQLSFIYKDIVSENIQELRKLVECMDKLQSRNEDLEERVILLEGELGDELTKNSELTLFLAATECVVEQLETLLTLKQNEKSDLFRAMEELEEINEEQKKQMEKISSDKDCLAKETEFLREENRKIDLELKGLRNEVEKNIIREESLTTELQMKNNEIQSWESQAATFFGELQISCIHQLIFEDKIRELTEAYEILRDRNTSNDAEIEFMKEKIISSEGENGRMKGQLAAYALAIQTLKDSISSLEKHAITSTKKQKVDEQEVKESATTSQHSESFHLPHDDQVHHDDSIELQDLSRRIQAIEVAFEEFESQTTLEKFNANAKLEKAMKEIQEVKKSGQESGRLTKDRSRGHERYNRSHSKSEISEAENDVLTKDIVLDRISDHSTYRNSQRETAAAGDRMLQLWESTDQDRSYNRAAGKAPMVASSSSSEYQRVGSSRRRSSKQPSNESLGAVEKLEISKSLSAVPREGNKRRILERLDSDAQKLTNLQITVQDLKKKMDVTVKEQVEEAEEDINKLYEMNLKLTKSVHDIFLAADGASSTLGPEENESVQSRRISEQARRGSEKIGRLQLELKKLQFLIMKLDGERESRGRSKVSERNPRVLLRDYLYGGTRTKQKQKKKKAPCCACVRPPPTRSD